MVDKHVVDPELRDLHVKVYAAIREAWVDYGEAPSQIQLRDATLYSTTSISKALRDLKRKGYITAPKFQARSAKPTDLDRTISNLPPRPWDELEPPQKFFVPVDPKGRR